MNKTQAHHALKMDHIDIDDEHLYVVDEDTFIYHDWTNYLQYTVIDAGPDGIIISSMMFKEAVEITPGEDKEYTEVSDMIDIGICPDCGMIEGACVCP